MGLYDELEKIKNELTKLNHKIDNYQKDWDSNTEKYYDYDNQLKNGSKKKQNIIKKMKKEMSSIQENNPNLEQELHNYKLYYHLITEKHKLEHNITEYRNLLSIDLQRNVTFLEENGFIHNN